MVKEESAAAEAAGKKIDLHVPVQEEAQRAQKIHFKTKRETAFIFKEARMGNALQTEEAVALVGEIIQSVERNPGALLNLARMKNKDDYTYLHSVAVCALMVALGKLTGF